MGVDQSYSTVWKVLAVHTVHPGFVLSTTYGLLRNTMIDPGVSPCGTNIKKN